MRRSERPTESDSPHSARSLYDRRPRHLPDCAAGTSTISDPTFPARRFGSQRILLYADADSQNSVTAARHNGNAEARQTLVSDVRRRASVGGSHSAPCAVRSRTTNESALKSPAASARSEHHCYGRKPHHHRPPQCKP